jgi:hypothetical protein
MQLEEEITFLAPRDGPEAAIAIEEAFRPALKALLDERP